MSNEYFKKPADVEPQTRALHTSVNTLSQATDQGFDAIPTNLGGLKSEIEAARDGEASLLAKEQAQDNATQTVANEIIAARDGEASLLAKEQAQDNATQTVANEIIAARDGEASLLAKEQAQDTVIQTVVNEVIAARDGEVSLLAKEQAQDTVIQTVVNEVIAARDGEVSLLAKEQVQDIATQTVISEVEAARDGEVSLLTKEQAQDNEIENLKPFASTGYPGQTDKEGFFLRTDGSLPYWDTLNGAIGNIMSPLLDLPLKNSLAMKAGVGSVHFERSTNATYVDRYGVVQIANIDEPRFEEEGLLIEGSSTNLLTYSQEFDNVAWGKYNINVTANAETAPDGTITANKIEVNNSGESSIIHNFVLNVTQNVTNISASVFVKKGNESNCILNIMQYDASSTQWGETDLLFNFDTKNLSINDFGKSNNVISYNYKELKNGWFRLSLTVTAMGTDTAAVIRQRLWVGDRSNLAVGQNIYVWGAQLEKLPFASSYIPTTDTAVTRAADNCYIDAENNANISGQLTNGTVSLTANFLQFFNWQYCFNWTGDTWAYRIGHQLTTTNIFASYMHDPFIFIDNIEINTKLQLTMTHNKAGEVCFYCNHQLGGTKIDTSDSSFSINGTKIYIGCHVKTMHINGHIKNLKIYDKCLTPLEVSLL